MYVRGAGGVLLGTLAIQTLLGAVSGFGFVGLLELFIGLGFRV